MPHRAPGSQAPATHRFLTGKPIRYYRPRGSAEVRHLIDEGFQAFNAARLSEAVSWGKVNPGVLPDTVVAYCDSTIAFPLFCEYVVGAEHNRRPRKELVHKRADLVADLVRQARARHANSDQG